MFLRGRAEDRLRSIFRRTAFLAATYSSAALSKLSIARAIPACRCLPIMDSRLPEHQKVSKTGSIRHQITADFLKEMAFFGKHFLSGGEYSGDYFCAPYFCGCPFSLSSRPSVYPFFHPA